MRPSIVPGAHSLNSRRVLFMKLVAPLWFHSIRSPSSTSCYRSCFLALLAPFHTRMMTRLASALIWPLSLMDGGAGRHAIPMSIVPAAQHFEKYISPPYASALSLLPALPNDGRSAGRHGPAPPVERPSSRTVERANEFYYFPSLSLLLNYRRRLSASRHGQRVPPVGRAAATRGSATGLPTAVPPSGGRNWSPPCATAPPATTCKLQVAEQ
jgi:hypothetical protein